MDWIEDARRLWPLVEQHLSAREERDGRRGGRPPIPDELVFERVVIFLRAGCWWEGFDVMSRGSGVSGRTVRDRLPRWRALGVFEAVCHSLRDLLPPAAVAHLDATFMRSRYTGAMTGLTRHGKGSKLQVLCNEHSLPISFRLTSANPAESTITPDLIGVTEDLPPMIVADRAYDADHLRDRLNSRDSTLLAPHR